MHEEYNDQVPLYDIDEILLKVALNTIHKHTINHQQITTKKNKKEDILIL